MHLTEAHVARQVQAKLLAPICPHTCDHIWQEKLQQDGTILKSGWVELAAPDFLLQRQGQYLDDMVGDWRKLKLKRDQPGKPKKGPAPPASPKVRSLSRILSVTRIWARHEWPMFLHIAQASEALHVLSSKGGCMPLCMHLTFFALGLAQLAGVADAVYSTRIAFWSAVGLKLFSSSLKLIMMLYWAESLHGSAKCTESGQSWNGMQNDIGNCPRLLCLPSKVGGLL